MHAVLGFDVVYSEASNRSYTNTCFLIVFHGLKNECGLLPKASMPSHGVDIIDGIPVLLKGGAMFAFQPGSSVSLQLGTYDAALKKATWELENSAISTWLQSYKESMAPRSRK